MRRKSPQTNGFTLLELMRALGSAHRTGPRTADVGPRPSDGAPPTVVPMPASSRKKSGFTLIELMLVVAIIGLLAAIAIPKFADLVIKAKEAAIKGQLGSLRSALSIYYADNEGFTFNGGILTANIFWSAMTTGGKYLNDPISISIPTQPSHTNAKGLMGASPGFLLIDWATTNLELAAWSYGGMGNSADIHVNCTHTDSKGTTWSLW